MVDLLIRNGRLSDGTRDVGVAVDHGRIVDIGVGLDLPASRALDAGDGLIIPGFVESHMHLDIALMNDPERPGRPAPFRLPVELNRAMEARRLAFTREDIEDRATRALALATRHGVTALRAQCHVDATVGLKHLESLLRVREAARDHVTVQIVAFPQQGLVDQPATLDLFREAFRLGADAMGCASNLDPRVTDNTGVRRHIEIALALAIEHDVDLDTHADMGLPTDVTLDDLEVFYLAQRAREVGYEGRVTAGHVCALDSAEPAVAEAAIAQISGARISVISQPDLYRLGRTDTRGVRRGLTRVKQLLAGGVNVAFASNNVRDAFRPLGSAPRRSTRTARPRSRTQSDRVDHQPAPGQVGPRARTRSRCRPAGRLRSAVRGLPSTLTAPALHPRVIASSRRRRVRAAGIQNRPDRVEARPRRRGPRPARY